MNNNTYTHADLAKLFDIMNNVKEETGIICGAKFTDKHIEIRFTAKGTLHQCESLDEALGTLLSFVEGFNVASGD